MKELLKAVLVPAMLICLFSCKQDIHIFKKKSDAVPNFGNVDFKEIFDDQDRNFPQREETVATLNQYYGSVWEKSDLWGGLLVAKADDILLEKYRGYAQGPSVGVIGSNTPLHVASVSKTITAMATLKLVEAGKIRLDDTLTKFFPGFPYPDVTVKSLLSQRSGLPKYEYFIEKIEPRPAELSKKFLTNKDILQLLLKYKPELSKETETGFMYCNTNFALLALIIEQVTQKPFPEAMKDMVFKPLKMEHSYVFQEKDTATAAKSFYSKGPTVYELDHLDLIYGDKNVYTTPRDLLKFSQAMFSKDFLKDDLIKKAFEPYSNEKPGINNYGLGFRMKIFDNGEKITYHNGWWHGSNAVFVHLLKSKTTIIAIGNKYSRKIYSAMALSGLFEDMPMETEKLKKEMGIADPLSVDSLQTESNYTE